MINMTRKQKENKLKTLLDEAIHIWYNSSKRTEWMQLLKMEAVMGCKGMAYRYLRFVNPTTLEVKSHYGDNNRDYIYQVNFRIKWQYEKMLNDFMIYLKDDELDSCIAHWEEKLHK